MEISQRNYFSFLWHALFLALAMNFSDVNTVIPNLILESGGGAFALGLMSAITIGGTSFMQLVFAGFLKNKKRSKPFLMAGIYLRVAALFVLGILIGQTGSFPNWAVSVLVFALLTVFSFSGSFASIAYMDVLGRGVDAKVRKKFFMMRQLISSFGIFASALLVRWILRQFVYPSNYSILFSGAGILLLVGTIGFWMIKESEKKDQEIHTVKGIKPFIDAIKSDSNLSAYLVVVNLAGLSVASIPFLIGLGKNRLNIGAEEVGNFLLIQIAGMIIANLIFRFLSRNERYKGLLKTSIILGTLLPLLALVLVRIEGGYSWLFLLSGAVISSYQVAIPGILIEISEGKNRAVYTGISGAGSLSSVVLPIIAGSLIALWGYEKVFIGISILILLSFPVTKKIVCEHLEKRIRE